MGTSKSRDIFGKRKGITLFLSPGWEGRQNNFATDLMTMRFNFCK